MSKLANLTPFKVETPENEQWKVIVENYNAVVKSLQLLSNKGVSFDDNVDGQIIDFEGTDDTVKTTFKSNLKRKAKCLAVWQIYEKADTSSTLASAPSVDWIETDQGIKIKKVFGLTASTNYMMRFFLT
jgi:hypothetical protein